MSIYYDKQKGAWRYAFKRIINEREHRATKLLPKTWSEPQAHAYSLKEDARLYAELTGVLSSRPTIEQAVLLFLEGHVHELKSATEYEHEYALMYKMYAGKFLDELPQVAHEINKLDVSPATRRRKIVMLGSACNYAYKVHNLGDYKPTDRVQLPKVLNNRVNAPTRKQMLQLARVAGTKALKVAIITAFYSGMRRSEIISAHAEQGVFKLYSTKNKSIRYVPIHHKLRVYAKEFPLVITLDSLTYYWNKARAELNLQHFHFHDLRHSTASELINSGVDLHTVGLILGHKDLSSTQRYAHMLLDTLKAAVNSIGITKKDTLTRHTTPEL